jgi:MYXO-CTERM domain-containing protein
MTVLAPCRKSIRAAAIACALVATPLFAHAATYTLTPVADATIFDDGTAEFESRADGIGPHVWTSTIASGAKRRMLLRFDFSAIPPGSTVSSVRLSLFQNRSRGEHPVVVHRVLAAWSEGPANGGGGGVGAPASAGDVTWVRRIHPGTAWATRGGDFAATPSTSMVVGSIWGLRYEWPSTPRLVADVQDWVDRRAPNHGWILIGEEVVPQSAKQFSSREGGSASVSPTLVVEAEAPVPGAGSDGEAPLPLWALGLLALGLGAALRARKNAP